MTCMGCASASNTSTSGTGASALPSAPETCWPVAPMRLVALEHGTEEKPIAEMQGGGSIYGLKRGERKFAGRLYHDALLDAYDTPSLTCVHREVGLPGVTTKGHYDAEDAYVDERTRIAIADDGTVTLNGKAGGVRVDGPIAKTRRTAILLVLAALSQ
jgi:hypothetical protein